MSRRTDFTGSALVRSLARLSTDADAHDTGESSAKGPGFADRLSQWLGWTEAIALSAALEGAPNMTARRDHSASATIQSATIQEGDGARVRATLTQAVADVRGNAALTEEDLPALRRRHHAAQQTMELAIGLLRARLRTALAARSPAHAQLADVDAVMEKALAARERRLLASVPARLERHAERLRRTLPAIRPTGWPDAFGREVHTVLLAELDLRMQPIEGLLDALRSSHQVSTRP